MRETSDILRTVDSVLSERRGAARLAAESRYAELCEKIPEYASVSDQIKRTGIRLGRIAVTDGVESAPYKETEALLSELIERSTAILSGNGFSPDYLENVHHCKKCRDTGYVEGEGGFVRCECFMEIYVQMLMKESNLAQCEDFSSFDLSFYPVSQGGDAPRARAERTLKTAKAFVRDFGEDGTKNLLFTGKTGVGKTFLCGCIAGELISRGIPVLYISAAELFSALTYFGHDEEILTKRVLLEKIIYTVELLIIDDLGTEKGSDTRYSILLDILNRRTGANSGRKRTVISSNLTPKRLQSEYDERIFSRIASFEICELTGDDIRILKKQRG